MTRFLLILFAVLSLLTGIAACGGQPAPSIINTELLQRLQGPHDGLVVLDVRTAAEYGAGHVPGAINIPHDELAQRINELRSRDNAEIVIYCESGRRAARAASILQAEGFIMVRHLQGDMAQWRRDRLPIENQRTH